MSVRPEGLAVRADLVILDDVMADFLLEVLEPHAAVIWSGLSLDAQEKLRRVLRALSSAPSDVDSSEGQSAGSPRSSGHEFTRKQTAVRLGVSPVRVSQLVAEGRLECRRVGRQLLIPEAAVEAELERRDEQGVA